MDISPTKESIEFYFDPISPFAWLASTQLEMIRQETGADIVVKPILFAGLLKAHGNVGPAEIPAKRSYTFRDVLRQAKNLGLQAECPPQHPFNPLLGLRICTAIEDNAIRLRFGCALMKAAWADGLDITLEKTIGGIADSCDLDLDFVISLAQDQAVKQKLVAATHSAVELGVFGVPTFRLNDQIFWGEDRIAELIRYANGQRIDEEKLSEILSRTAATQRKK